MACLGAASHGAVRHDTADNRRARWHTARMSEEPNRERTMESKVDELITLVSILTARVEALEREILPQDPDPEIGLP